ncbi:TIGR03016 family PEP-CTERM system-associated outer membrane protein [Lamprobacter modestohalophilus]|uniref:TIGR03016 family PEP-CTERM system-associated outer membrane protein n=2 Tax=Lamprobacter modestohalophilus TaxID=1064514 RepID=A0A9X0W5J4_9GAMM|nr:TIGR03016 family PEP-CTERM system-associated outer membrane protein [Lamprobacter modestohalophilus]
MHSFPHSQRFQMTLASLFAYCGIVGSCVFSSTAAATDWNFSKQVALDTTFSDNINLSASDKESDVFASLTPGFVLQGNGRQLDVNLAYAPRLRYYLSESSNNRVDNNLQANATTRFYDDRLSVDFSASARQTFIDPFLARGDAANNTDNVQTTYSYAIAPLLRTSLGRYANAFLGLEQTGVFYSDQGADSYSYGANFELRSDQNYFGRLLWGVLADTERVDYDEGQNDFSSVSALLGYQLSRRLAVDLFAGYENNSYASANDTRGFLWGGGFSWIPTPRTSLRAEFGEHYFGTTSSIDFNHRRRRSVWSATYSRELTSARSQAGQTPVYNFETPFGDPTIPNVDQTQPVGVDNALPNADVFIADRFNAQYALELRRGVLTANARYVHRDFSGAGNDQSAVQLGVDYTHQLSGKLSGLAALNWRQTDQSGAVTSTDAERNEQVALRTGLRKNLSEHWNFDFLYQLQSGDDYTENRVTFGIAADW